MSEDETSIAAGPASGAGPGADPSTGGCGAPA